MALTSTGFCPGALSTPAAASARCPHPQATQLLEGGWTHAPGARDSSHQSSSNVFIRGFCGKHELWYQNWDRILALSVPP